jgi:hypothetical protein
VYSSGDRKQLWHSVVLEQYTARPSAASHAQFEVHIGQIRPFVDGGIAKGFIDHAKLILADNHQFKPNAVLVIMVIVGLGAALEHY